MTTGAGETAASPGSRTHPVKCTSDHKCKRSTAILTVSMTDNFR